MVDGVCLVVCATEGITSLIQGPMTQTKFVLTKALARNLKPLVVMNKMDRPTARPDQVENELLDLFISLDATDDQLDYPTIYASAREGSWNLTSGWATPDLNIKGENIFPLLDKIIQHVPHPTVDTNAPFSMLVTVNIPNNSKSKATHTLENVIWEKYSLE